MKWYHAPSALMANEGGQQDVSSLSNPMGLGWRSGKGWLIKDMSPPDLLG